jgi:hypothetical protein
LLYTTHLLLQILEHLCSLPLHQLQLVHQPLHPLNLLSDRLLRIIRKVIIQQVSFIIAKSRTADALLASPNLDHRPLIQHVCFIRLSRRPHFVQIRLVLAESAV